MWRRLWSYFAPDRPSAPHWPKLATDLGEEGELRDRLLTQRVIAFLGPTTEEEFIQGVARMLFLLSQDPAAEIKVWLDTPGGHMLGGLTFYDVMRESSAPVSTHCLHRAGGIASLLLAAGAPGRRFILPHAVVSLSEPSLPDSPQAPPSVAKQDLRRMRRIFNDLLADRSGQPKHVIRKATRKRVNWFATEAILYGVADALEPEAEDPRRTASR